jgi:hypothetical protein
MDYTKSMNIWQHFSKRTLALIVALALITAGLLYLAIRQDQPTPEVSMAPTPTVSPAHTTLALVSTTATTGARQTAEVVIDSHRNTVSGVQLNLSYDPTIVANVTIQQGKYFTNPNILLKTVDQQNGRITLVMAIQPTAQQASGSGTVATISYTLLPTTKASTTISFLPKTAVTQEGELSSVLAKTTNLTIAIPTRAPQLETVPATSAAQ